MNRVTKTIIWILCIAIILFIVASAAFPMWVSKTEIGKQTVLNYINKKIHGNLTIQKIDLKWFGKQHLEKLLLSDAQGSPLLSFDVFETETPLLYLIFGGRSFGDTLLKDPYLNLTGLEDYKIKKTSSNTSDKKTKSRAFSLPKFKENLTVNNGIVEYVTPKQSISITAIEIAKDKAKDLFLLNAHTQQEALEGEIHVESIFQRQLNAKVTIQNFPVAILDAWNHSPLYVEALGPTLNGEFDLVQDRENALTLKGSARSQNLTAYIEGSTENKQFILSPQTHVEFLITPLFFKQLINEEQRGEWELASKTPLHIQVEKGIFPLNFQGTNFQEITFQATAHIDRAELHHQKVGSYSLKQFDLTLVALKNLEVAFQGEIQGKEATKLAGNLSITPKKELLFDFTYKGFPVTLLELFSTSLEKNVRFMFGHQFDLTSQGTYINGTLETHFLVTSSNTEVKGSLDGTFPHFDFIIEGSQSVSRAKAKVIGPSFNFDVKGVGQFKENELVVPFLKGAVKNRYFEIDFKGHLGKEGEALSASNIDIISTGIIKSLPIESNLPEQAIKNGTILIQVNGPKNLISIQAEATGADITFDIHHFIQHNEIKFDQSEMNFQLHLEDFPLALITPFVTERFDLQTLLGNTISMESKGIYTPTKDPRLTLDMDAQGVGFALSLAIALDGTLTVSQNKPSYIYWEITPSRYDALMRGLRLNPEYEPTFTLIAPTQLELTISQFTCPSSFQESLSEFLCQSGFIGDLHLQKATFKNKQTQETFTLDELKGSLQGENFSKAIDLFLKGRILAANVPQTEESTFSFDGKLLNLWKQTGHFNREGLTVTGMLSLDLIPVRQILGLVPLDSETRAIVQAVLGELVNARIYGEISQLTGPLTVDIKSSNFKTKLSLQLDKHFIYLRDYVDAELTLTEAVNETLLKDIAPLFIAGAYSEHPIKVYIEPQGFALPIAPYSLQNLHIGKAIFDIGKIRVRNGGQIQSLMDFLKAKEITPEGDMDAWFTPIFISLNEGVATYKRFDALLAGNMHIALWGSINLLNGQVNMTLGIAPTTLYQRFKIVGLTKKDLFQVKMRGTTNKLELDWSSAYTRIGFMIARTAGGHIGYIIGGILEQLVSALGEEPAPPPTTDPLPWETQYSSEPGESIPQEAPPKKRGKGGKKLLEFLIP